MMNIVLFRICAPHHPLFNYHTTITNRNEFLNNLIKQFLELCSKKQKYIYAIEEKGEFKEMLRKYTKYTLYMPPLQYTYPERTFYQSTPIWVH